jgi:muramoyltetrapeptide carboxypeptidase LdcA involved in peptidoglycan recycling
MLRALAATGVLREALGVLLGRPFSADGSDPKFVVPIGVEAEIDCDRQQIRLLEPATIG